MILYLDTSALVKLYVQELGSDAVRSSVLGADVTATSIMSYAEARATFARLRREQRVNDDALALLKNQLLEDWPRYLVVATDESLIRRAGDLAEAFALRGYDSVQLAAAEYVRMHSDTPVTFACFDQRLSHAASVLGMGAL